MHAPGALIGIRLAVECRIRNLCARNKNRTIGRPLG